MHASCMTSENETKLVLTLFFKPSSLIVKDLHVFVVMSQEFEGIIIIYINLSYFGSN